MNNKSKIAWFHSHFLIWAGGTKFVFEITKRLNKIIPVDIYVEQCSEHIRNLFKEEGITVRTINTSSSMSKLYWLFFPFYLRRNVKKISQIKSNYQAFVTSMFPMNYALRQANVTNYLTYIFEPFAFFHDRDMINGFPIAQRILLKILAFIYKGWDMKGVQDSNKIMTINKGTQYWIKEIYKQESITSLLGVDSDRYLPNELPLPKKYQNKKIIIQILCI